MSNQIICFGCIASVCFTLICCGRSPSNVTSDVSDPIERTQPPGVVILKLDDLRFNTEYGDLGVLQGWIDVFDYLNSVEINASLGLIASQSSEATQRHIDFVRGLTSAGHELWHHGWDHNKAGLRGEFCDHPYENQKAHFEDAVALAEEVYGITLRSFGSPYNCSDETFTRVFEEQSVVKVFMFGDEPLPDNALNLNRRWINMESETGTPDFGFFIANYLSNIDRDYYVLQGHPRFWVDGSAELEAFSQIVEFLQSEKHQFMTPYEYFLFLQSDNANDADEAAP